MCPSFPERKEELDKYEAIIVEIYNVYGDKFYEYYKLFSLNCKCFVTTQAKGRLISEG
jgi:hypothetical protein